MAASLTIANYAFSERNRDRYTYIYDNQPSNSKIALSAFFSFYLILNSFIPLELPVVLEISKMITTQFMQSDVEMCYVNKQFKEVD